MLCLRLGPVLGLALALAGCASGGGDDAGSDMDAGPPGVDSGPGMDAGPPMTDAGPPDTDAGPPMDAGPPFDAGPFDAGPPFDAGDCAADSAAITISEVMISSQSGSGDFGEWFELKNEASCTVSLAGLEIQSGAGSHTIASGILTAGGYFVLSRSGDAMENHELQTDYVYGSSISLSNGGGALSILNGGTEIARVTWGSTDYLRGASRQLSRSAPESTSLGGGNWCNSSAVYSMAAGGPFLGTPGMQNVECP